MRLITIKKHTDKAPIPPLKDIIKEDRKTYDGAELDAILDKKKNLREEVAKAYGVLGFVRFVKGYYLILITRYKRVGLVGMHSIFKIKDTKMVPLFHTTVPETREKERSFLNTFENIDLKKNFYFSYTYDITNTLQTNILRQMKKQEKRFIEKNGLDEKDELTLELERLIDESQMRSFSTTDMARTRSLAVKRKKSNTNETAMRDYKFNSDMVWNYYLTEEFYKCIYSRKWMLPIIFGYITQSNFNNRLKHINFLLISRRFRHFYGPRYLKRGLNEKGCTANFVETE